MFFHKLTGAISSASTATVPTSSSSVVPPNQDQQSTPTAYIAPSRINKIQPSQQQQSQQQPQASSTSSTIMIRRTAAVQPQPHDSGSTSQRQQYVSPLNAPNNETQSTISFSENIIDQSAQQQQDPSSSLSVNSTNNISNPGTSASFVPKRNREDDQ